MWGIDTISIGQKPNKSIGTTLA